MRGILRGLLREDELRRVRLGARGGVLVHDARFHGFVHGRRVSRGGGFRGGGVTGLGCGFELLVQGLQAGFDSLIARLETGGFARSFDRRFGVGHVRYSFGAGQKPKRVAESQGFCRKQPSAGAAHETHESHEISERKIGPRNTPTTRNRTVQRS